MKNLPQRIRIFSDITGVSRGAAIRLNQLGLIDDDCIVVPWVYLNPFLRDRKLSDKEAKQLVVLEVSRTDGEPPRGDLLARLVNYIGKVDREKIKEKISKFTS